MTIEEYLSLKVGDTVNLYRDTYKLHLYCIWVVTKVTDTNIQFYDSKGLGDRNYTEWARNERMSDPARLTLISRKVDKLVTRLSLVNP